MKACHICGRHGLKAFGSTVCSPANRESCVDLGRARLGMNPNWHRLREKYPWMAEKRRRKAA